MATYVFKYDDAYLVESFDRARRIGWSKYFRGALKAICLTGVLLLLAISLYAGITQIAVFCMLLIFALGIGPRIDYYIARRRLRKSVFYNTETRLDLDSTKLVSTYPTGQAESNWTPFSKAVRLADGFLVYFDNNRPHWWPDSALREGTIGEVADLFRDKSAK